MRRFEARRLKILAESEAMGIPAFLTPTWVANYGEKPADHPLDASELVNLHHTAGRHANALDRELKRAAEAELVRLAYGADAPEPFADAPDALAEAAYDELERRQTAKNNLMTAMGLWSNQQ